MPDLRDMLPPPPWEGPPIPKPSRIRGMTELEALSALQAGYLNRPGGIKSIELIDSWGFFPRTKDVLEQFKSWRVEYENPDLYWDKVIANLEERLREAEESKRMKKKPPLARY